MRNFLFPILCLCCQLAVSAQSQNEKRPVTHEDIWLMKRLGSPAVSPNGKWAIFSVNEPAYDEKEQLNDIWIVATDGKTKPRRLTANKAGESGYSWSPDGKYIAFVAKRDGDEEPQIYLLNFAEGGEAQRLTTLAAGAAAPRWSPDSKAILFQSAVYSGCFTDSLNRAAIEEKKKQKYKARVYTTFPIRDFDKWLDERQTHLFVQAIETGSKAQNLFADVRIAQKEGFKYHSAAWTADSKGIVFSATLEAHTLAYQEPAYHLYQMSASGGDATPLTKGVEHSYFSPHLTDDGKYLLCTVYPIRGYEVYELPELTRFDFPTMAKRTRLAPRLDRPILSYTRHQQQLYLVVEDQGRDYIYTLPIVGGEPQRLTTATQGCHATISLSAATDQPVIVCGYDTPYSPVELVRLLPDGSQQPLTAFNSDLLQQLDLQPVETIWTETSTGAKVRSMVIKPAGFDPSRKYPLFVVMHGGPASSFKEHWSLRWNAHLLAQPGYVLLLTDYTGSTGYGAAFAQGIRFDPFRGPAQEINDAATDAIHRFPFIDGGRQAAGGGSYGGHLANWMQATTRHYKCLICHAGLVNSVSQWSTSDGIYHREVMNGGAPWQQTKTWKEQNPFVYADQFKTPTLITIGELDYRVPLNNAIENWHILQRLRIPSRLIVFPEENHWITKGENSRFFYQEVHKWLDTYLLK